MTAPVAAPSPSAAPASGRRGSEHGLEPQQWILLVVLAIELLAFSYFGKNFVSWDNARLVPKQSVELGLLALAMTPVIVTGGIDLSVGSLLGLCAVVFGRLWKVDGLPFWEVATLTLLLGMLGGWVNSAIITRIGIPPLIVTLGTYSLYHGIAEGITKGSETYTNFPSWFTNAGDDGYQILILMAAIVVFYLLQHRSTYGRAWSAIGYSPQGAAHAGIPVRQRIGSVYVISGFCAALGAIIYCARIGQAKSDAGTDYELSAITAVVLGGTSIFGGRGSIIGTVLGLFALALLENGLQLSSQPREIAGILKGILLLAAIGADWRPAQVKHLAGANEELNMRNSQLAALSVVILIAALIVMGGNYMLVQGLKSSGSTSSSAPLSGPPSSGTETSQAPAPTPAHHQYTIAMMPKATGNAYFIAAKQGADEAAQKLGVKLLWDGPTNNDPAKQNEIVQTWIVQGVDAICVSVDNKDSLTDALKKARAKGIKVITWDADSDPDTRDFFVNQATPEGIGDALMDDAAASLGDSGSYAIITATLTAANQQTWIKYIEQRNADKYPNIKMVEDPEPCDDDQTKAFEKAKTILAAHPEVKMIIAVCTPAVPGAAEAIEQSGRSDVHVVGLGLPNDNKKYVHDGVTSDVVLWNTMDLGYLTVCAAAADCDGTLKAGATSFSAGKLGTLEVKGDNVMLGTPYSFTKDNIDKFNF